MVERDAAADLLLVNARVVTLDPWQPFGGALAIRAGRVLAVGALDELRPLAGPATEIVDGASGLAVPAFHDAHLHLLSYARARSRLDCRDARSMAELGAALAERARALPPGAWLRAWGYDEARLGRHPDRDDLDAAVPGHPVRLQHRSLHLDVLNTTALRQLRLLAASAREVERDPATGEPTGRLYHAAKLLRGRLDRPSEDELAGDVRQACEQLLAWGVTTVQDASATNGVEEWELFHRLAARGALPLRLFMLPGADHWPRVLAARPPSPRLGLGPVKIMLDEATSHSADICAAVADARRTGLAVAIHAVSEAEVAIALEALRTPHPPAPPLPPGARGELVSRATPPLPSWAMEELMGDATPRARWRAREESGGAGTPPPRWWGRGLGGEGGNRLEHGAVIPDAWLDELWRLGVMVVGQPALVYERGDVYRAEYPPELHGWLHRAASLRRAGVRYAAGSDAPVTEPAPGLGLFAARTRLTRSGAVLGPGEVLNPTEALAAYTAAPAAAVGAAHLLGRLRPGALADVAVLDPDAVDAPSPEAARRPVRLTITEGRVVWRRDG